MSDYSYRAPISHFWKIMLAKQKRLAEQQGRKPFDLEIIGKPLDQPANYIPVPGDIVCLTFYDTSHTSNVLVVEAEHQASPDVLDITLFNNAPRFLESTQPAYQMWDDIFHSLLSSRRLIDHRAQSLAESHKITPPPEPPPGSSLESWFDWYHDMHAAKLKCTLSTVAQKAGFAKQHVRGRHARYLAEKDPL